MPLYTPPMKNDDDYDFDFINEAMKQFVASYNEVQNKGQEAVNAFIWPLLADESFRRQMKIILKRSATRIPLTQSVFAAPTLNEELVDALLTSRYAGASYGYYAVDLLPLSYHPNFNERVFLSILRNIASSAEAEKFLEEADNITLDYLVYAYRCLEDDLNAKFSEITTISNSTVAAFVTLNLLLECACKLEPDLPKEWVRRLLVPVRSLVKLEKK